MHYFDNRGAAAGRHLKGLAAAGGSVPAARAYAASQNWPDADQLYQKAAVGGLESEGNGGLAGYAERDFLALAWAQSLVGQLTLARRASFTRPALQQTAPAVGAWTPEGGGIGLSLPAVARLPRLQRLKVCAGIVTSQEAIEEGAEEALSADLARAVAYALDLAFVDASSGDASRPDAINAGAAAVVSIGDAAADINEALVVFQGELSAAAWMCHPATAAAIALQIGDNQLGALGGRLAGLPCLTSESFGDTSSNGGEIILLDQRALQLAGGDQAELRVTVNAMVEMSDAPTGATLPPTAASAYPVSLFQADGVALLGIVACNWRLVRTGAVVRITGADYARFSA